MVYRIDYWTDYNQETYGIPSDQYTIIELYERDELWFDDDVIDVINNGVSIINHVGHGTSVSAMKLSSTELNELTNMDKYCLFYTQACHSGQLEKLDECFAERWVNIPKKGGFAAIMNTGYGYGSTEDYDGADNRYAREFFDALFSPHEKITRIGKANQDSKEDNIWHINDDNMYHGYYTTTLFGDPYVSIKGAEEASAEFSWSPEYPNTGEIITFYDESEGINTYRKWEFSDGYITYEKNPKHVFSNEKTYKVTLTVMDKHGYISTKTKSVEVKYQWNPIANIDPQNYNGYNFTIYFSGNRSWDPDGNIVRYSWDFDDGTTSDLSETFHTYDEEGTYLVSLLVEDDDGNFDRKYSTIVISQQFPPETPSITNGPTSTFSGEITNFSFVSTDVEGDDIQYGINWDDGSDLEWTDWYISGEICTIFHKWNSIGNYKVKVKARDSNYGESNWSEELIVVVTDEKEPFLEIQKPVNGIYIANEKRMPFFTPLVFGSIDIEIIASDGSGIDKVLFFIDDKINPIAEVLSEPYKYNWDKISFNRHTIKILAIDNAGKQSSYETTVWKFL
jgi:PKD repeat protein